jgi:hypothetical protein
MSEIVQTKTGFLLHFFGALDYPVHAVPRSFAMVLNKFRTFALFGSAFVAGHLIPGAAAAESELVSPDVKALALQGTISLPPPPIWSESPQTPLWSIKDIASAVQANCSAHPQLIYQAQSFVRPDLRWLKAYVKWFGKLKKPLNLKYQDQAFDCDKFARCFVAFADLLARKGGEGRASVCVGWVTVNNETSFGEVGPGNGHALVLAGTTEGLFVIEPQSGEMAPLAEYPNRNQLQQLNF